MDDLDMFVWPDGFWLFREEFTKQTLRGSNYKVVKKYSPEWVRISEQDPKRRS